MPKIVKRDHGPESLDACGVESQEPTGGVMFSLDVVRWRDRQQKEPHNGPKAVNQGDERLEMELEALEASMLPHVHQDHQAAERDKRLKRLYGRTQKEMHDAYLERVTQWMEKAPKQKWVRDYSKHIYSKEYVPRERTKAKELGGPMLKTNLYSPRGVYKGGGECVHTLVKDDEIESEEHQREPFQPPVRFIEKSREKDKEIQPPMSVPKNKPLECGHYFVEDVICSPDPTSRHQTHLSRPGSRATLRPLTEVPPHHLYDPPPTTAEYVALPQWRDHEPQRWTSSAFVSTVSSSNAHTAQNRSITGVHYPQSVLTSEEFVPPHKRHPLPPKDAALNPRDHERRAQTAAAMMRETRSPRRTDRKYFTSMWTQPGSPGRATPPPALRATESPSSPNGGHILALRWRENASRRIASPRKNRAHGSGSSPVRVRPLSQQREGLLPSSAAR